MYAAYLLGPGESDVFDMRFDLRVVQFVFVSCAYGVFGLYCGCVFVVWGVFSL